MQKVDRIAHAPDAPAACPPSDPSYASHHGSRAADVHREGGAFREQRFDVVEDDERAARKRSPPISGTYSSEEMRLTRGEECRAAPRAVPLLWVGAIPQPRATTVGGSHRPCGGSANPLTGMRISFRQSACRPDAAVRLELAARSADKSIQWP